MDLLSLILLLLTGGVAGLLASVFAVDVGIILVPVVIIVYRSSDVSSLVSTHLAMGTSLLVVFVGSLPAASRFIRSGHVLWKAAIFVGAAGVVGAAIGSGIAGELEAKTLQIVFALIVTVAAIRLLFENQKARGDAPPRIASPALSGVGLAIGFVSSLAGIGGEVFLNPTLYNTMKFPLKKAIGTSSAAIVIIALSASLGYMAKGWGHAFLPENTAGYVDYVYAIPLIIGTVAGVISGESITRTIRTGRFKRGFAVLLIVIAVEMLLL